MKQTGPFAVSTSRMLHLMEFTENPVTKSVYKTIIGGRIDSAVEGSRKALADLAAQEKHGQSK